MNKVKLQFLDRAIVRPGGWTVFSKIDAIEFIDACKKEQIQILGIDGFYVDEDLIQPCMANSIDYTVSGVDYDNKHEEAINFLLDQDESMFFEIVTPDIHD
jgi:hypothetical protein